MRIKGLLTEKIAGLSKMVKEKPAAPSKKPCVDYPQAGEKVQRGHYAVRISSAGSECQISINEGDWQDCRHADGFAWFDWQPETAGSHRISVRTRQGAKWVKADRSCEVA